MGQRYSKLPSEILRDGLTLDLAILGIVQKHQSKKTDNDQSTPQKYTQDQMLEMLERAKNGTS